MPYERAALFCHISGKHATLLTCNGLQIFFKAGFHARHAARWPADLGIRASARDSGWPTLEFGHVLGVSRGSQKTCPALVNCFASDCQSEMG